MTSEIFANTPEQQRNWEQFLNLSQQSNIQQVCEQLVVPPPLKKDPDENFSHAKIVFAFVQGIHFFNAQQTKDLMQWLPSNANAHILHGAVGLLWKNIQLVKKDVRDTLYANLPTCFIKGYNNQDFIRSFVAYADRQDEVFPFISRLNSKSQDELLRSAIKERTNDIAHHLLQTLGDTIDLENTAFFSVFSQNKSISDCLLRRYPQYIQPIEKLVFKAKNDEIYQFWCELKSVYEQEALLEQLQDISNKDACKRKM